MWSPSRRNWSRPWLDASIATCATPRRASSASSRWRLTGSGVVSAPGMARPGAMMPSVPRLAAGVPVCCQIWRVKAATEVLPLVPVTAAIVAGCGAWKRAAISARRRRGLGSAMSATDGAASDAAASARPRSSVSTATAPRLTASAMNRRPSSRAPGSAAKSQPGRTSRESAVRPRMSGAAEAGRDAARSPFISSVRRKLFDLYAVDGERAANLGRVLVDRGDSEEGRHALDRMADDRRRGPAACREAVGFRRAVRLVDDGEDEVARIVDREGAEEGGQQRLMSVAVPRNLLCRSGLAADDIARRRREFAGALLDDEAHETPHVVGGAGRHHLLSRRDEAGRRLDDRRRMEDAAIDDGAGGDRELKRADRDAVAEGDRHRVDVMPRRGDERSADLGDLENRRLQEAEPSEEVLQPVGTGVHRHARRADIRGILEDLRHAEGAMEVMVVVDGEAPDMNGVARVIGAGERRRVGVERHRRREDLEGRPHLVGAERRPVEDRVGRRRSRLVGIEIGKGDESEDLASVDVHHQTHTALGREILDRAAELVVQNLLQTDIDRQLQRLLAFLQNVVEPALDAGEALVVESRISDDMGDEVALGVDAALLALELETGDAELVDLEFLARRQEPLQPHEAAVRGELRIDLGLAQIGKDLDELLRRFARIENLLRIGKERGARQRRREQDAIAIDDIGAADRRLAGRGMRDPRLARRLHQRDIDEAQRDDSEGDDEEAGGDEEPRPPDIERLLRRFIERNRSARRRLEVPRLARIVVVAVRRLHCTVLNRAVASLVPFGAGGEAVRSGAGAAARAAGLASLRSGTDSTVPSCFVATGARSRKRRLSSARRAGWLRKLHSALRTWIWSWSATIARLTRASSSSMPITSYFILNMAKPRSATRASHRAVLGRIMRSSLRRASRRLERHWKARVGPPCARQLAAAPTARAGCGGARPRRAGWACASGGGSSAPVRRARQGGGESLAESRCRGSAGTPSRADPRASERRRQRGGRRVRGGARRRQARARARPARR